MNILIAIAAGLAGGAVSAVAVGYVAFAVSQAMHVYDRDGGVAYFSLFLGLLGGLIGMVLSIVLALRWRSQSGPATLVQTPMALVGIIAVVAIGIAVYYYSHEHPVVNGAPPVLDFELRPPGNAALPNKADVQIRMQAGSSNADGWWDGQQSEQVDGRPVLTGHLQLYLRTSDRLLVFGFPGGVDHLFKLRLPASPLGRRYQKWSKWQPTDFVFTPASRIGQAVAAENSYQIRYLVEGRER